MSLKYAGSWTLTYLFTDFIGEMNRLFAALDRVVEGEATPQEALDWAQREAEGLGTIPSTA